MTVVDDQGAVIRDRDRAVRLTSAGAPTEVGQPTFITIQAGPFSGALRDDTVGNYQCFRDDLTNLHRTLSGTAKLSSYEGFALVLSAKARGTIAVEVEAAAGSMLDIRLRFDFEIDQSYLPKLIQSIEEQFLSGPNVG